MQKKLDTDKQVSLNLRKYKQEKMVTKFFT